MTRTSLNLKKVQDVNKIFGKIQDNFFAPLPIN